MSSSPVPPPPAPKVALPAYYVFLDETGNFDFSPNGSRYLILSGVGLVRAFPFDAQLGDLRFDFLEQGLEIEAFHASEDKQHVRNAVFGIIQAHMRGLAVHAIVVDKRKTNPALRSLEKFYPKMMALLIRYIVNGLQIGGYSQVIAIADTIGGSKKKVITGATKIALARSLPAGTPHRVLHHESASCYGLQVADYMTWAIGRKYERADTRSYALITSSIRSEFGVFANGTRSYY